VVSVRVRSVDLREPTRRYPGQRLHPLQLGDDDLTPCSCHFIRVTVARRLMLPEPSYQASLKQTSECAVNSSSAQTNATVGHRLDVLHDGVAMPRLRADARQNQENRLSKRLV